MHTDPGTSAESLARDIDRLRSVVENYDEAQRDTAIALQTAVEDFHREGLLALIRALNEDPASRGALKSAVAEPLVYAMLRYHGILKPSMEEQVQEALAEVRPLLEQHQGDVELVAIQPPDTVTLRLLGNCQGCDSSAVTLKQGIEQALRKHCDWVEQVIDLNASTDPDAPQPLNFTSPFAAAVGQYEPGESAG